MSGELLKHVDNARHPVAEESKSDCASALEDAKGAVNALLSSFNDDGTLAMGPETLYAWLYHLEADLERAHRALCKVSK